MNNERKRATLSLKRLNISVSKTLRPFDSPKEKEFVRDSEVSLLTASLYGLCVICLGFMLSILSNGDNKIINMTSEVFFAAIQVSGILFLLLLKMKIFQLKSEILPDVPFTQADYADRRDKKTKAFCVENPVYEMDGDEIQTEVEEDKQQKIEDSQKVENEKFGKILSINPINFDRTFVQNAREHGFKEISPFFILSPREAESPSFFLKLAFLIFASVGMITPVIKIVDALSIATEDKNAMIKSIVDILERLMVIIYTSLQSYVFFKHSNISINFYLKFCKFGFVHLAATNVCLWLRAVVMESEHSDPVKHAGLKNETAADIHDILAPYLYPFHIEYSVMAALFCYTMGSNVGKFLKLICTKQLNVGAKSLTRRFDTQIQASIHCQKSNKSVLFGCIFLLISTTLGAYIGHVNEDRKQLALMSTLALLYATMLITVIWLISSLRRLPRKQTKHYGPDTVLLGVSLSVALIFKFNSILDPMLEISNERHYGVLRAVNTLEGIVAVAQMCLQVFTIELAMSRDFRQGNDCKGEKNCPRFAVTILIPANLGVWFFYTLTSQQIREVLPRTPTSSKILSISSLPLVILFHFHSLCCFANIWRKLGKTLERSGEEKHVGNSVTPTQNGSIV